MRPEVFVDERDEIHERFACRRKVRGLASEDYCRQPASTPDATHAERHGGEQDPELLPSDAARTEDGKTRDTVSTANCVVKGEPTAERNTDDGNAIDRQRIEHLIEPLRICVGVERWPRRRAQSGFADHVECVNTEARREGGHIADPHDAVAGAAVEQQQRWCVDIAARDDKRLALAGGDADLLVRDGHTSGLRPTGEAFRPRC